MSVPRDVLRRFINPAANRQIRDAFEGRIRRLVGDEANQNFVTSVIGSAWKPLLLGSLAPESVDGVEDHVSRLFTLEIQPHVAGEVADVSKNEECGDPDSECVLGLPMWPYGVESAGRHRDPEARIDARSFIVDSCNKYALVLGTLALCEGSQQITPATMPPCFWNNRRDAYWIQGREYNSLPTGCDRAFEYPRKPAPDASCDGNITFNPAVLPESPLGHRVASVFDVRVYTPTTETEERYDSTPFSGMFHEGSQPDIPVVEQTNLLLSEAAASSHFRPFFLGNGENQWTALKLAEAYGRIATNHKLQVHLLPPSSDRKIAEIMTGASEKQRLTDLITSLSMQKRAPWVSAYLPPELKTEQDLIHLEGYNLRMLSKTGTALRGGQYRDSAVFAAVLEPYTQDAKPDSAFTNRGLAVIVMIADSPVAGTGAASRNAVRLFTRLWPEINSLLRNMAVAKGEKK